MTPLNWRRLPDDRGGGAACPPLLRYLPLHRSTLSPRTLDFTSVKLRSCVKVDVDVQKLPVPNSPYSLGGRKATLNKPHSRRIWYHPTATEERKKEKKSWDVVEVGLRHTVRSFSSTVPLLSQTRAAASMTVPAQCCGAVEANFDFSTEVS